MELKIFWTGFAKNELKNIFNYYKEDVGLEVAQKVIKEIIQKTSTLSFGVNIGPEESAFENRKERFRYLVYRNYKIIYWHNEEKQRVEVVDIFNTKQNPEKIKRN